MGPPTLIVFSRPPLLELNSPTQRGMRGEEGLFEDTFSIWKLIPLTIEEFVFLSASAISLLRAICACWKTRRRRKDQKFFLPFVRSSKLEEGKETPASFFFVVVVYVDHPCLSSSPLSVVVRDISSYN